MQAASMDTDSNVGDANIRIRAGPSRLRQTTLEIEEDSFELRPLTSLESDVQSSTHDEEPQQPLLLVKLTGYRLLTMTVITTFGTVKAVLAYRGDSVAPNTLDWFIGVFITIILFWLGQYENVKPPVAAWFFHEDLILHAIFFPAYALGATTFSCGVSFGFLAISMNIGIIYVGVAVYLVSSLPKFLAVIFGRLSGIAMLIPAFLIYSCGYLFLAIPLALLKAKCDGSLFINHRQTYSRTYNVLTILALLCGFYMAISILSDGKEYGWFIIPPLRPLQQYINDYSPQ